MQYEGLFCKMRWDGSVFYYAANKPLSTALFWSKYNHRIEIPISAIIEMKVSSVLPFSKGLTLKIRSGLRYEKVKTLDPMNITGVPEEVIQALQQLIDKSNQQNQSMTA